ncbi:MAG: ribonuclease Z [Acidimicrobiales bacterium]|nr:ribonuclease Z [Acidimicrobiales bacterium]
MDVVLLGTGNPLPDPNRAGSATLVRAGGTQLLFDAGRGVLLRAAAAGTGPAQWAAVLLTHLHSDHLTDLNDVITTHWVQSFVPTTLQVYGPPGTREVVDGALAMLGPDIGYRLAHHADLTWRPQVEVTELLSGPVLETGGVRVVAEPTDHRPVEPSVGYRVEHDGRSVVIGGDGIPCEGLDRLCAGADAYVQTVLRDDLVRMVPVPRFQDTIDYHSTVAQAAQTAARAGVRTLVLTHYVPGLFPGQEDEWRALAAEHFAGEIVLGDDLTTVTV